METKNLYTITIDNYNGVKTELYNSETDAIAALNKKAEELEKNQTPFNQYANVIYTEECVYRVQSIDDLANARDRIIYTVNQSVYTDKFYAPSSEWRCAFSTLDEAVAFFKERLQMYKMQKEFMSLLVI